MFQTKDAEEFLKYQRLVDEVLDIEDVKETKEKKELHFIKLGAPSLQRTGVPSIDTSKIVREPVDPKTLLPHNENNETYLKAREILENEMKKRDVVIEKDVFDIYPHCIKVEKETYEYPVYREIFDSVANKMKEQGIEFQIYTF